MDFCFLNFCTTFFFAKIIFVNENAKITACVCNIRRQSSISLGLSEIPSAIFFSTDSTFFQRSKQDNLQARNVTSLETDLAKRVWSYTNNNHNSDPARHEFITILEAIFSCPIRIRFQKKVLLCNLFLQRSNTRPRVMS